MKIFIYASVMLLWLHSTSQVQSIFTLDPSQSMLMTGKGKGQDAIINPYFDQTTIAIVENIGEKEFSIRIQSKGKIIEIIEIKTDSTKKVLLLKDYELYLDTEFETKAKVTLEKLNSKIDQSEKYINLTLQNKSLKSILVTIPTVMNPNLSPLSNSSVSLKIGQNVYFTNNSKDYILFTVDKSIEENSIINVSRLLKKRKKELGLE